VARLGEPVRDRGTPRAHNPSLPWTGLMSESERAAPAGASRPPLTERAQTGLDEALAELARARTRTYYDAPADQADAERYYAGVALDQLAPAGDRHPPGSAVRRGAAAARACPSRRPEPAVHGRRSRGAGRAVPAAGWASAIVTFCCGPTEVESCAGGWRRTTSAVCGGAP
jgi:hypothetical protein